MAGKRKRKSAGQRQEDLSKPTVWRRQHGEFSPASFDADPYTGAVVVHRRAVDTLGLMLEHGTITQEMHDAGCTFRALFRSATFDSMSTSQILRMPRRTSDGISERQVEAHRRVAVALDALGGHDSATGSCAWFVIGLEFSVREWAMRQGWGGRLVPSPVAQGVLVATLSVLAGHFGLARRPIAA